MLEGDGLDRVISSARRGSTRARGRAVGGDDDVVDDRRIDGRADRVDGRGGTAAGVAQVDVVAGGAKLKYMPQYCPWRDVGGD
ncbi:MAG: hypothetical protein VX255_16390 [Candidatus Latescibacterota bacterium]|nr:hypothetical protein [Candidatus Latescibacterota bacterium]